ncbi:YciI family protein [Microbispora catharanthi]|uniref:YCII-related domain-containing protein n=1 Tax=Microbispora catharanthi TaxID=1712871 RepID=A0A5N6BPC2_9ACTN|nr:YciI family protein [Microbispora catharanthi]KAB8182003.1 hypothetical protein FH610_026670 [Microbispora catharanthi]
MRFLMTTKGGSRTPDAAMMAEMGAFIEEMTKAGVLLATGGLEPGGLRMISSGGEITVTDGPFTEAKEAIVSFALIEARSREEAVELARRFWKIVGDGESAIQQVFGPEDGPEDGPGAGPR